MTAARRVKAELLILNDPLHLSPPHSQYRTLILLVPVRSTQRCCLLLSGHVAHDLTMRTSPSTKTTNSFTIIYTISHREKIFTLAYNLNKVQ